jgi:hypothetical protein
MGGLRTVIGQRSVYNNTSFMCVCVCVCVCVCGDMTIWDELSFHNLGLSRSNGFD